MTVSTTSGTARCDHVVPIAVEVAARQTDGLHLGVGHGSVGRVLATVQATDDPEARAGGGPRDQLYVNLVGYAPDAPHKAADLHHWMGNGGRSYASFEGSPSSSTTSAPACRSRSVRSPCRRQHPAGGSRRNGLRASPFRPYLCVHFRCGPATRSPHQGGFVDGLQVSWSPFLLPSKRRGLLTLAPGRTHSH